MAKASGLYIKQDNLPNMHKVLQGLVRHNVFVGYPESSPKRDDTPLTNAAIAFIQEHGSPANNIPARPFMIPGVIQARGRIVALLRLAALAAFEGNYAKYIQILNQLGLVGVSAVQRAITVGAGWPPLSPRTIAARRARGVTRIHPLIDTGQLRQGVKYVIRVKRWTGAVTDLSAPSNIPKEH